ncbi:MAG: hypothetical protein RIR25_1828 [Verrucomicrobiota bacterium]|jgi:hypothetical protein
MAYLTYEINLEDIFRDNPNVERVAGGTLFVCNPGTAKKTTLYDPAPATFLQALANPVTFTRGRLRFMTLDTVTAVDIYGLTPTGQAIVARGVKPQGEPEYRIRADQVSDTLVLPINAADYAAGSETSLGIQLPANAIVLPQVCARIITAESSRTLSVGLLSSESGGNATGFLAALSMATAGLVRPVNSGTPTRGALLTTTFATTPSVVVSEAAPISTSRTLSVTPSASSASFDALVMLPFMRPPV